MIVRRVLLSPLLSGGDGLYPWFGSVYGGSGMGLGVGFLKRLENASYFNFQTGISINSSMVMRGTFAAPELWRGMLQMDANVQWLDAHDVSFYGLGQDSSKDTRDSYDFNPLELSTNVTLKPIRNRLHDGQLRLHADRHASRDARLCAGGFAGARRGADLPRDAGDARLRLAAELRAIARAVVITARRSSAPSRAAASPIRSTCRNTRSSSSCRSCANSSSWRATRW